MKTTQKIQHRKSKKQFWKLTVFCEEGLTIILTVYCDVLQNLNFSELRQKESIKYSLFEVISYDLRVRVLLLPLPPSSASFGTLLREQKNSVFCGLIILDTF